MKVLDVMYVAWLIFVTSHCLDLQQQNYTQDKAMEKMDEAILHLNEKIKILSSNQQQSYRKEDEEEEERKTELHNDSQKKEIFGHPRNGRSEVHPSLFSFDDFYSRVDKEKSKRTYQRKNDLTTVMMNRRDNTGDVKKKKEFLEQEYPFRKLLFQTNSSDKHENTLPLDEISEAFADTKTKCFLIEENKLNLYEPGDDETMFKLSLDIKTDALPHETSWALFSSHNRNEGIIDSMTENFTTSNSLLPHTLYTFEYECYVTAEDTKQMKPFESYKEICYDFDIYDSTNNAAGSCCVFGSGYFTVNINEKKAISARLYGLALTTSFCVDSNGELIEKEKEKTQASIYPSRDCINGRCICDSNPALTRFEEGEDDDMYQMKMNVMVKMMALSGNEKLMDISTPQYKAACWTLNDDSFSVEQLESTPMSSRRIEQRMIQRYILALFYFATNGQNWAYQHDFLSSRSECEWNTMDLFYNNDFSFISGSVCDENERVMYIVFGWNNLNGTIIDELYGLKSLEQLLFYAEKDVHGNIPSSLGRLSELRSLIIGETSVGGSIPSQLFGTTKMQLLGLLSNNLSGTIPESIGNLQHLSRLRLDSNSLSGSLPKDIYYLKNLVEFRFAINELTGTISPLISNMENLKLLTLNINMFSGTIPSSMKHLRRLKELYIENNKFSGTFPNFLWSIPNIDVLSTHNNNFTGSVSDQFCDVNRETEVTADCRNDIFNPKVRCSCCSYCLDESPTWNGECPDTKVSVHIDHKIRNDRFWERNSDGLIWSLKDHSSEKNIIRKGPFEFWLDNKPSYEACIAHSQCISLVMSAAPVEDTNYTIFLNEESVYNGTFAGKTSSVDFNISDSAQTVVSFQYDIKEETSKFDNSKICHNLQLVCDKESILDLEPNTTQRILYDATVRISGETKLQDSSSPHSKALCWILSDEVQNSTVQSSVQALIQRYILTLLHLTSKDGLFGTDEYPPLTHECEWQSIDCFIDKKSKIVTGISLSSSTGQIINGTLIHEIGSLAYLEELELRDTELIGTIPRSFSNLWSLKKLDLSQNKISGVIPETLFRQLDKLEHIDLSLNLLEGNIPYDMGSYSPLRIVLLNSNQLKGSLPFKDFNYTDLETFDVHENLFDGIDFPLVSKHTKLKKLDLSSNFLVGTLQDELLETLTQLEIFNISQNEFSGALPSKFPLLSKITHFDVHSNKIKGTIHDSISKLSNLEHLNLQGNQLTGSIPNEMNQLEKLNTLVLSHNKLKGHIPLDSNKLSNMTILLLHANELSGKAPEFMKIDSYISDCGVPSKSVEPVQCNTCNVCCNSKGLCHTQIISLVMKPMTFAMGFIFSLIGFMFMIYVMKDRVTQYFMKFFEERVASWTASPLIGEKSVYHFFLIPNEKGWLVAWICVVIQMATLTLFNLHADTTNEDTDLVYSMSCSKNSLECEDTVSQSAFGYSIFSLLLASWLLQDILGAFKLFLLSLWRRNIDFFFASSVIIVVTLYSFLTSIYYNLAIATKDTEIIANAVILLFVNEIDERLFQMAEAFNIEFVNEVEESLERNSYHDKKELLIYRSLHNITKRIQSMLPIRKKDKVNGDNDIILEGLQSENEVSIYVKKEGDDSHWKGIVSMIGKNSTDVKTKGYDN